MIVFLEKLYVQTFVSRRGRKFPIRIDERKWLVKVSSNFVEIELDSCKDNDPTRVCGRLFFARARPDPNVSSIRPRGGLTLRFSSHVRFVEDNSNNTIPSCRDPVPSSRPGKFG